MEPKKLAEALIESRKTNDFTLKKENFIKGMVEGASPALVEGVDVKENQHQL